MKMKQQKKAFRALAIFIIALITVTRTSVYAGSGPIKITVEQIFTTTSANAESVFTYMLKPLDINAPAPSGNAAGAFTFTIEGNGAYAIGPLTFDREGVYRYEIYQVIGTEKPGYAYDKRVYTVEAHVSQELNVTVTMYNSSNLKADKAVFENNFRIFPSDPAQMPDIPVIKTVSGDPDRDSEFTFTLKADNPSAPMPTGSAGGVKSIRINGPGKARFGTWEYSKSGTYFYTVYEENTGARGYTYDTAVYTITDRVIEENGRLVLSRIVTNDMNKPVSSMDFHNSYKPAGGVLGGGRTERDTPGADITDDGNPFAGFPEMGNPPDGNAGAGDPATGDPAAGEPAAGDPAGSRPGVTGPKTGDDTNTILYVILLAAGGVLVVGALLYLITGKKRKSLQNNAQTK